MNWRLLTNLIFIILYYNIFILSNNYESTEKVNTLLSNEYIIYYLILLPFLILSPSLTIITVYIISYLSH